MIRSKIDQYKSANILFLWFASLLVVIFITLSYISFKNKIIYDELVHCVKEVEVSLFEITTFTKRMILEMDESMKERIIHSEEKLNNHLSEFKKYVDQYDTIEIEILEDKIFELFSIVDKLTVLEKEKSLLIDKIRKKIVYIDDTLKTYEKNLSNNMNNASFHFYKIDVLLSKLARELGAYLKTDDEGALLKINKYFNSLKEEEKQVEELKLTNKEKKVHAALLDAIDEKNSYIHKIIAVHQMKRKSLLKMGKITDTIDQHISEGLNSILKEEAKKSHYMLAWSVFVFLILFIMIILFVIRSKSFLSKLTLLLEDGFGQLLKATEQISSNIDIDKILIIEEKNEFRQIGKAMIEMQHNLVKSNLSRDELEKLLNNMGDFRCIIHSDNLITLSSENLYTLLGYGKTDSLDVSIFGECFSFSLCKSFIKQNLIHNLDWHLIGKNKTVHHVRLTAVLLSETSLFIIGEKLTSLQKNNDSIQGVILLDGYGNVCDYNSLLSNTLHLPNNLHSKIILEDLFEDYILDKKLTLETMKNALKEGKEIELELTSPESKEKHYLFLKVYELFTENLKKPSYAIVVQDMTQMFDNDKLPLGLSKYDALTNLLNRAALFNEMNLLIKGNTLHFGLMIISLTKFRDINDAYGYEVGDNMLSNIANRLKIYFGEEEIISRFSGDEFAIICTDNIRVDIMALHVSTLLEFLHEEMKISGHLIYPKVHIGISLYPDDGTSSKILLREANIALARAKKNNTAFAFSHINKSEDIIKNIELAQALPNAIKNAELSLCYQPQIDTDKEKIFGLEALIRWNHPKFGEISPLDFIPIAEETDMINEIGLWLFKTVSEQMIRWKSMGKEYIKVAVNVSAKHFESKNFTSDVINIVSTYKIDPKYLQIEITESQMQNIEHTENIQHKQLVDYGFSIAIDDFGTGFSSLILLRKLYIHTIKIDKYFIDNIVNDSASRDLLSGILAIAEALSLQVIIEGVETEAQVAILKEIGFTIFQGYYFSKPLKAEEISEYKIKKS